MFFPILRGMVYLFNFLNGIRYYKINLRKYRLQLSITNRLNCYRIGRWLGFFDGRAIKETRLLLQAIPRFFVRFVCIILCSYANGQEKDGENIVYKSGDGHWIIRSDLSNKKSKIYAIVNGSESLKVTFPFQIQDACFSKDGGHLYLLHSKTFWNLTLSLIDTENWNVLKSRKISDYTTQIELNADESSLITIARTIIKRVDTQSLRTQQVIWESSKMHLMTTNPQDPLVIAIGNKKHEAVIINMKEDSSFVAARHDSPITSLVFDSSGMKLTSSSEDGLATTWNAHHTTETPHRQHVVTGILPIISYSPDTRLLLGASSSLMWGTDKPRPSLLTAWASYAFSNQVETGVELNHFSRSGWQFSAKVNYQHGISTRYFGTGMHADESAYSKYRQNTFWMYGNILRNIHGPFFLGLRYSFRNDFSMSATAEHNLISPSLYGGITSGLGVLARIDSRNNSIFPTKGVLADVTAIRYAKLSGSDYTYNELLADARQYHSLGSSVLAFQFMYHATFGGTVPFYSLPYLGNDRVLRGSWRNLYIDRQAISLQAEIRRNFTDRDPRHGYVAFAGVGNVSPVFKFSTDPAFIGAAGLGYRWQIVPSQKLYFRLDASLSSTGTLGIFSGIGTSF